jgi:hypothetical protein
MMLQAEFHRPWGARVTNKVCTYGTHRRHVVRVQIRKQAFPDQPPRCVAETAFQPRTFVAYRAIRVKHQDEVTGWVTEGTETLFAVV